MCVCVCVCVCEGMGCDRYLDVVGHGWVCRLGGVCVLIFVFAAGIEASGVGVTEKALYWLAWIKVSEVYDGCV